eukprot:TRINITY_DN1230_c0_g1_i1.p1 TRINITY_DN1230_c0_g1~~TRINITY_DN1230_c0_g1_i1.p1  ORF type:complete len:398 (+),score=32.41 TRINITY_DN1230_c0_g1_i1:30-1196(+)
MSTFLTNSNKKGSQSGSQKLLEFTGSKKKKTTDPQYFSSLRMCYITNFLMFMDILIIMPTIYQYIRKFQKNDEDVAATFLGWVLTSFSLASFISTPIFAAVASKTSFRTTLAIGLIISAAGNLLYAASLDKWMILSGRIVSGVGKGVIGIVFGYIAQVIPPKERTAGYIKASGMGSLGLTLGPGIAGLMAFLPPSHSENNDILDKILRTITPNTLPGYFTALCCLILLPFVLIFFRNPETSPKKRNVRPYLRLNVFACLLVSLGMAFNMAAFTSFVTPETYHDYDWGPKINGLLFFCFGLILIPGIVVAKFIENCTNDRISLIVGLALFAAGIFCDIFNASRARFIVAMVLLGLGYAMQSSLLPAMFSKILPKKNIVNTLSPSLPLFL